MGRKPVTIKTITVNCFRKEAEIVERIQEEGMEISGFIRELLRNWDRENSPTLPGYVQVAKEKLDLKKKKLEEEISFKNLPPEDYCVNTLGGCVKGANCVFMARNGNGVRMPLATIKEKDLTDPMIDMHHQILNGTWTEANGLGITEAEVVKMRQRWEEIKAIQE